MLLHQEVLAGVGNVFKSEICFVTGINPFCKVAALSADRCNRCIATARSSWYRANVLEDSGDTIVTYRGQQRRTTHRIRSRRKPVGLWPHWRALPPLRRADSPPHPGPGRARHLLVPHCQPMPDGPMSMVELRTQLLGLPSPKIF